MGGQLPPFDDINAANELIGALVMGLWNRLTRHQERSVPFRLLCFDVPETSEGLHHFVLTRRQELGGFVGGLFGKQEHIDLPERAHRALNSLSEMRAMRNRDLASGRFLLCSAGFSFKDLPRRMTRL